MPDTFDTKKEIDEAKEAEKAKKAAEKEAEKAKKAADKASTSNSSDSSDTDDTSASNAAERKIFDDRMRIRIKEMFPDLNSKKPQRRLRNSGKFNKIVFARY